MDANRRQSGIQQLLAAEQEAQQIVNAARAGNILSFFSDQYAILFLVQTITNQASVQEQVPCA
jgi:hypothetical protein